MELKLPVPVLKDPHWRVNFRTTKYQPERIPTLQDCFEVIEKTKLSLRGWDYPHLGRRDSEHNVGRNWIASWSDFRRNEYWRLYQSGQFIHLFSVDETTDPDWFAQSKARAKSQLGFGTYKDFDWNQVPGFFSVLNFLFTVTEIFEFAARLCETDIYEDTVVISIEIKNVNNFVLVHEWGRAWMHYYSATQDNLGNVWEIDRRSLVAKSAEYSLDAAKWFFERFQWFNRSDEILRNDQQNFLKGRF